MWNNGCNEDQYFCMSRWWWHQPICNQFYLMDSQLNGSSYYRANPYYQQGYMPDSALRNRKAPAYMVEIPQGEQYFEPTNKKHFQRLGYYSTIAQDAVINHDPLPSPAREKQYFRSLNIDDIEGASTNTLISKAVKNKNKAKQQLALRQRQQEQEEARQRQLYFQRLQDDSKRKQALNKIKPINQPNYHEKVMKLRTEETQQQPSPQTQKKEPIAADNRNKKYEEYQNDLLRTQNQIRQLQRQLNQGSNSYQNSYNSVPSYNKQMQPKKNQYQPISQNQQQYDHRIQQANQQIAYPYRPNKIISPIDNYQPQGRFSQRQPRPNLNFNQALINQPEQKNHISHYRNYSGQIQQPNKLRSFTDNPTSNINPNPTAFPPNANRTDSRDNEQKRSIETSNEDQRYRIARQTREKHRKFNPTYLSYGSASIGLAGKNIVGY